VTIGVTEIRTIANENRRRAQAIIHRIREEGSPAWEELQEAVVQDDVEEFRHGYRG
jgi:hypothetical protein